LSAHCRFGQQRVSVRIRGVNSDCAVGGQDRPHLNRIESSHRATARSPGKTGRIWCEYLVQFAIEGTLQRLGRLFCDLGLPLSLSLLKLIRKKHVPAMQVHDGCSFWLEPTSFRCLSCSFFCSFRAMAASASRSILFISSSIRSCCRKPSAKASRAKYLLLETMQAMRVNTS
jgi:hypothetical protein